MANPRAGENGKATRFKAGKEQAKTSKKGAKKSAEVRRAQKEALDVFKCAKDHTSQEDLAEAYAAIMRFAKRGSLPHWQEVLRLTGQEEQADTEVKVSFGDDTDDLSQ